MVCNRTTGSVECCPNQACSREAMKTEVLRSRYLAIVSKHRARLCSILSLGEMAVYQASAEKRAKALIASLKRDSAEARQLRVEIKWRKFALRTFAAHERAKLSDDMIFFFQAEDGIRYYKVTGVQTCALPI